MPWRTFGAPGPCSAAAVVPGAALGRRLGLLALLRGGGGARAALPCARSARSAGAPRRVRGARWRLGVARAAARCSLRRQRAAASAPRRRSSARRLLGGGLLARSARRSAPRRRRPPRRRGSLGRSRRRLGCLSSAISYRFGRCRCRARARWSGRGPGRAWRSLRPAVFSSSPVACWKRRPKILAPLGRDVLDELVVAAGRAAPWRCHAGVVLAQ